MIKFIFPLQKRLHRVATHVGRYGKRIAAQLIEEGLRIFAGGVANVTPFRVRDGEVTIGYVRRYLRKGLPARRAQGLEKGQIGFVGYGPNPDRAPHRGTTLLLGWNEITRRVSCRKSRNWEQSNDGFRCFFD